MDQDFGGQGEAAAQVSHGVAGEKRVCDAWMNVDLGFADTG